MVSTRRAWIPLLTIGVAFAGFVVGLLAVQLEAPREYEHVWDLHLGLIALAWSLLALVSIVVSTTNLLRNLGSVGRSMRWIVVGLNVVVTIALAGVLTLSITSLNAYTRGIADYQKEVRACGHPPVLAIAGWGGDVLLPKDPDYERLKYSPADHTLLGNVVYFCTLADAEAHGYKRQAWHNAVPCSDAGCPVAAFFASPMPYPRHPRKHDGTDVPTSEIAAAAGPALCFNE